MNQTPNKAQRKNSLVGDAMEPRDALKFVEAGSEILPIIGKPISAIIQKANDRYERSDDYLAQALVDNGVITDKDEEIAARLLLIPQMHRRIRNLAKILKKADALYEPSNSNHASTPNAPSEDWMDFFIEKASAVSDEEVEEIWAAILAGECTQRGAFKKVMLDRLALLDKEMAEAFASLCQLSFTIRLENGDTFLIPMYLRDDELAHLIYSKAGLDEITVREYQAHRPKEHVLKMLQEVGLISLSEPFDEGEIFEPVAFTYEVFLGRMLIYQSSSFHEEDSEWHNFIPTGAAQYTFIGKSLCQALAHNYDPQPFLPPLLRAYFSFQESLRAPATCSDSEAVSPPCYPGIAPAVPAMPRL